MEMGESHEVGEDLNWKRNLIVLWCCVFLVCASYTMVIPFLPLFLLKELQLPVGVAKMWSGGIIAITFVVAGIMAPFWGARGDVIGQKKNALRAGIGLGLCYFLSGMAPAWAAAMGVGAYLLSMAVQKAIFDKKEKE
jgi:Major Facilitator Superfamily.